jgi:apolipoprotein D and lipocalin family protein
MDKLFRIFFVFVSVLMVSCAVQNDAPLKVVETVDFEKYSGKWYEIARLPNSFEEGLECCTAFYSLLPNGKLEVINTGHLIDDHLKVKKAKGKAYVPNDKEPGKIKVSFFGPFYGNYWIIALDKDYQYALVGEPSRKYLWVLARQPNLPENDYQNLINHAKSSGFNADIMIRVKQECGN